MNIIFAVTFLIFTCTCNAEPVSEFIVRKFGSDAIPPPWYVHEVIAAYTKAKLTIKESGRMMEHLEETLAHLEAAARVEMAKELEFLRKLEEQQKAEEKRKEEWRKRERKRKENEKRKIEERKRKKEEERRRKIGKKCRFNVAGTINRFHFNMQKHILGEDLKNSVYSPLSIYVALAILSVGAAQNTKNQITSALAWKTGEQDNMDAMKYITTELKRQESLDVASNGWISSDINTLPKFDNDTQEHFGVKFGKENFENPETARDNINQWVKEHSRGMIKELFGNGSISAATKLVLANALFFNGSWAKPFDKRDTRPGYFTGADGRRIEGVQFMQKRGLMKCGPNRDRNVLLLELPYKEGFSMLFARPSHPSEYPTLAKSHFTDISTVGKEVNGRLINNWLESIREYDAEIRVPKFTISQDVDLKQKLQLLGIIDAFNQSRADFSGMTGNRLLYLNSAVHKAVVDVNEVGTKGGAGTGFEGVVINSPFRVAFDRPFLFFILKKPCNAIIFSGRVMDPSK